MKLFIANGTLQNITFCFRCPNTGQVRYQPIHNRKQVMIDGYSPEHVKKITDHLDRFGARPAAEADRVDSVLGLIYKTEKEIPSGKIDDAIDRNKEVLKNVASDAAESAGLAAFRAASQHSDTPVNETEMEVVQLDAFGQKPMRGGVDYSATVSRKATGRQDGTRRAR